MSPNLRDVGCVTQVRPRLAGTGRICQRSGGKYGGDGGASRPDGAAIPAAFAAGSRNHRGPHCKAGDCQQGKVDHPHKSAADT